MFLIVASLITYALPKVTMEPIGDISAAESFQCNMCVDRFNWTNCDESAKPRNCSDKLVRDTHNFLAQYNINLNHSSTVTDHEFRCFRLELEIDVTTVQVFIRGCTYDDTLFCNDWVGNGAKATNCAVCSTDMCERNTTGDPSPTTETPLETVSTSAVSTIDTSSTIPITVTDQSTPLSTQTYEPSSETSENSTTQNSPTTAWEMTEEPCSLDWTTTTTIKPQSSTKAVETLSTTASSSQSINVTQSSSQELTTTSTNTSVTEPLHGDDATPAAIYSTTLQQNGAEKRFIGFKMVALVIFVSFVCKAILKW